jgi:hypothetical protein
MRLVSRSRLAAVLQGTDRRAVADFVAALYAARGYTVDRPGDGLLRLEPGNRTVAVRPDGEPAPAADVVVVPSPPENRSGDGVDVVDAGELHEQLHYAVDRAVARELLSTQLDLETALPSADAGNRASADADNRASADASPEGQQSGVPDTRPRFPWRGTRQSLVLAAAVGVAVLAVVVGGVPVGDPATDESGPTITGTPTAVSEVDSRDEDATAARTPDERSTEQPTETAGEQSAATGPPGVDREGLANIDRLITAHRSRISGTSYAMTIRYREFEAGQVTGVYVETIRVENESRYSTSVTTTGSFETSPRVVVGADVFASNGTRRVQVDPTQPFVSRRSSPVRLLGQTARYLRWSLSVESSTLRGRESNGNHTTYRVTTDGDPYQGIRNASGTVYVTESGLITYGRWTYTTVGSETRVEFSVQTTDVGSTTVGRPGWVDETE